MSLLLTCGGGSTRRSSPPCNAWGTEEFEEVEAGEEVVKIGLPAAEFFQRTVSGFGTAELAELAELRSFKALPPEPLVVSKARSFPWQSCAFSRSVTCTRSPLGVGRPRWDSKVAPRLNMRDGVGDQYIQFQESSLETAGT